MDDHFAVSVSQIPFYVKYKNSADTLCVIDFDIVKDNASFYPRRFECSHAALKRMLYFIDEYFAGRICQLTHIDFTIPWMADGWEQYPYSFVIHPASAQKSGYWIFDCETRPAADGCKGVYSFTLDNHALQKLKANIIQQMEAIDWENVGKTEYFLFDFPEKDYAWCYSASRFEARINALCAGHPIEALYVSTENYASPLRAKDNFLNYDLDSRLLIQFDVFYLDMLVHAEGLFQYRIIDKADSGEVQRFWDWIPEGGKGLCDTGYVFSLEYAGKTVENVSVVPTACWPWRPKDFDRSKLGNPVEIPQSILFLLENGSHLTISGWDDDFSIEMAELNSPLL